MRKGETTRKVKQMTCLEKQPKTLEVNKIEHGMLYADQKRVYEKGRAPLRFSVYRRKDQVARGIDLRVPL